MNTLISHRLDLQLTHQFSHPIYLFHFPLPSRITPNFHSFPRKSPYVFKKQPFCYATASDSLSFGGWDDPTSGNASTYSGESTQLQSFLNSLGFDDKKYIIVYLLGFVCALAISRVKVSSIVAFPVCIFVFIVGFSIGFVNRGNMSLNGGKKRYKDEIFRGALEKLKYLAEMLSGIDVETVYLKNDVMKCIDRNKVTADDLERFLKNVESVNISASGAKIDIEGYIENLVGTKPESQGISNQKSNRIKKEKSENGLHFSKFVSSLFQEKSTGLKPNKANDSCAGESMNMDENDPRRANILAHSTGNTLPNSPSNRNVGNWQESLSGHACSSPHSSEDSDTFKMVGEVNANLKEIDSTMEKGSDREDHGYWSETLEYLGEQHTSLRMSHKHEVESWASTDALLNSMDFRVSTKHIKTEESFRRKQKNKNLKGTHRDLDMSVNGPKSSFRPSFEEETLTPEKEPVLTEHESYDKNDFCSSPRSVVSEDMDFSKLLTEASSLLKEAKKRFMQRNYEKRTEQALYEAALLLSKAIEIRPMSLLAVGQLGNTYLLHGELKLSTSRKLRALLTRTDLVEDDVRNTTLHKQEDEIVRKDRITSLLVDVCEECEELLVKAGRQYRLALSIDGNDMRALYNWGLALSFRAQLIADIGPDAARDADRVFLAAIDKFDAMMSKSNDYAPDALFRWGAALQQRSRLRPSNSKEKVKLLQQAKRLYEDALHMNSANLQLQEALSSCISELHYFYW